LKPNRNILFGGILAVFAGLLLFATYGIGRVEEKFFTPFSFEIFLATAAAMFLCIPALQRFLPKQWQLKHFLYLGIGIRLLLFFAAPNLSDDYYRFIWDGAVIKNGHNPFHYLPSEIITWENAASMGFTQELYEGFNSQNYYSVYPPVNQFIYWMSSVIGGNNIYVSGLVMRFFLLLGELGSMFFLLKLLEKYRIPLKQSLFYILNPLILFELNVNLHFEGLMVCFLLGAIYMIETKRMYLAGLFWGLAICTKLLPLAFLPLLLFRYKFLDTLKIGTIALLTTAILFVPFYSETMLPNMQDSLDRYFGFFFFNAGLTYAILGYFTHLKDYEFLRELMPVLKQVFVLGILGYTVAIYFLRKTSMATYLFWGAFLYFILAGILHPWYITILVPLGILSKKWTGIAWSFLILLSYSAYRSASYAEDYRLIAVEFGLLLVVVLLDILFRKRIEQRFFTASEELH